MRIYLLITCIVKINLKLGIHCNFFLGWDSIFINILTLTNNDILSDQRHTSFKFCTFEVTEGFLSLDCLILLWDDLNIKN